MQEEKSTNENRLEEKKKLTNSEKMQLKAEQRDAEGYQIEKCHEFPNDLNTVSNRIFIPSPNEPFGLFRIRAEKQIKVELRGNWNISHLGSIIISEKGWTKINNFATQVLHITIHINFNSRNIAHSLTLHHTVFKRGGNIFSFFST